MISMENTRVFSFVVSCLNQLAVGGGSVAQAHQAHLLFAVTGTVMALFSVQWGCLSFFGVFFKLASIFL